MKKATIVFVAILIVTGFLFLLREYHQKDWFVSFPLVSGTGTVMFVPYDEGFWCIVSDDGGHYEIYLRGSYFPVGFQVDGLRVHFSGYKLDSGSPKHMWGVYIILIDISRLDAH